MKTLRKFLAAMVLTYALTFSAMAGDMSTGVAQTPLPRVTGDMSTGISATAESTATGEIGTGASVPVDPITGIALSLLQSLLALF